MTSEEACQQPNWRQIVEQGKAKIELKFPEYGNSWVGSQLPPSWWKQRLLKEIDEIFELPFSPEDRQKEITDAINILAMMHTNCNQEYWEQVCAQRWGLA